MYSGARSASAKEKSRTTEIYGGGFPWVKHDDIADIPLTLIM